MNGGAGEDREPERKWILMDSGMNDRRSRDRLSSLYASLLRLTWLHMLYRTLLFQRWVIRAFRRVLFGVDTRPPPRPTTQELRDLYG